MPDENDNEGTIEAEEGRLPAPTRAPEGALAERGDQARGISDEDLDDRQRRMGTRRKPAGPTDDGARADRFGDDTPSDVPETDVQQAREIDPERFTVDNEGDDGGGGNDGGGGPEPFESSERE